MVGSGENKKSMAYVGNVAAFLLQCIQSNVRNRKYNYVDKPDFTMNELVTLVRERLGGRPGVGLRIPWVVGILGGYFADFLSLVGIKLPISSIRVKKFCSTSEFSSAKDDLDEFQPPFTLQEGLERTLLSEFINPDPKKIIFFTE
jgi:nucleoside-diphosphate-sugar epimerase